MAPVPTTGTGGTATPPLAQYSHAGYPAPVDDATNGPHLFHAAVTWARRNPGGHAVTVTTGRSLTLPIEGMTCAACAARIERLLNRLPGTKAAVNFAAGAATIERGD
ncbi:heavy-metal-associated domain-containing protein, partial [Nguyenibacter vanlangensis]|nr:heavy-metal-associated domain-containing protein [Nguyenibacter vanlangensis]